MCHNREVNYSSAQEAHNDLSASWLSVTIYDLVEPKFFANWAANHVGSRKSELYLFACFVRAAYSFSKRLPSLGITLKD